MEVEIPRISSLIQILRRKDTGRLTRRFPDRMVTFLDSAYGRELLLGGQGANENHVSSNILTLSKGRHCFP